MNQHYTLYILYIFTIFDILYGFTTVPIMYIFILAIGNLRTHFASTVYKKYRFVIVIFLS